MRSDIDTIVRFYTDGSADIHGHRCDSGSGRWKHYASTYFNAHGELTDVEHFWRGPGRKPRAIKRGGPLWRYLAKTGKSRIAWERDRLARRCTY